MNSNPQMVSELIEAGVLRREGDGFYFVFDDSVSQDDVGVAESKLVGYLQLSSADELMHQNQFADEGSQFWPLVSRSVAAARMFTEEIVGAMILAKPTIPVVVMSSVTGGAFVIRSAEEVPFRGPFNPPRSQ